MINSIEINEKIALMKRLRDEATELRKQYDSEKSRIDFLYKSEIEQLEKEGQAILDEVSQVMEVEGVNRVVCLNGKISKRNNPIKFNYLDEDKLVEELKDKDDSLIRTKFSVDKTALKKAVQIVGNEVYTASGELLENVRAEDGGISYYVQYND